jgi:hypothetical protein
MEKMDKNKDVILNFGLIAVGPLREIEKLQRLVIRDCQDLKIVYQTVSAKRLRLEKLPPSTRETSPVFKVKTTFTGESKR